MSDRCRCFATGNPLVTLPEATDIEAATREMQERQIRRLLVTGEMLKSSASSRSVTSLPNPTHSKFAPSQVCAELIEKVSVPAEPVRS